MVFKQRAIFVNNEFLNPLLVKIDFGALYSYFADKTFQVLGGFLRANNFLTFFTQIGAQQTGLNMTAHSFAISAAAKEFNQVLSTFFFALFGYKGVTTRC